ncbi:MAG: DUF4287 domain-containing protein [Hamadaea sp.]|uniref:DUF4287 domain-containing protein n=1 Tax=Hamadaea sp. TaxID=2024425 RepID=UPI0018059A84|nr:DUF4287 domain-containing protein [Hamadaea sp.]NUT20969.1 DUF4287 domain-containing protein [Hamadaea sp.]
MSFQAYLDNIEDKTGLTPRQLITQAQEKGFDAPGTKAGVIVDWLKADYDLGRGHAMAIVHVLKNGDKVGGKDAAEGEKLWLEGKASKPA